MKALADYAHSKVRSGHCRRCAATRIMTAAAELAGPEVRRVLRLGREHMRGQAWQLGLREAGRSIVCGVGGGLPQGTPSASASLHAPLLHAQRALTVAMRRCTRVWLRSMTTAGRRRMTTRWAGMLRAGAAWHRRATPTSATTAAQLCRHARRSQRHGASHLLFHVRVGRGVPLALGR